MNQARFIVFEGGEGSGKSTASAAIAGRSLAAGISIVQTREPGGTPAGELVRGLLHEKLTPSSELCAFLLALAHLVETVIRPARAQGDPGGEGAGRGAGADADGEEGHERASG